MEGTLWICNWETANMLLEKNEKFISALVITSIVEGDGVYLIPKDIFQKYLEEICGKSKTSENIQLT